MGYELESADHIGCSVITARSSSRYLTRWLKSYKTFNDEQWADHTVLMAGQLAKQFPDEIDVFPENYFYQFSWRPGSIELLWEEHEPQDIDLFEFRHAYAPHYWGTIARAAGRIQRITPFTIITENVALHQILRPLLPSPYFSLVVHCTLNANEYWKMHRTMESLVEKTFPLWEILLVENLTEEGYRPCSEYTIQQIVPKLPRLHHHREKSIRQVHASPDMHLPDVAKVIWQLEVPAGRTLHSKHTLAMALDRM